jgi:hypothetical protein
MPSVRAAQNGNDGEGPSVFYKVLADWRGRGTSPGWS